MQEKEHKSGVLTKGSGQNLNLQALKMYTGFLDIVVTVLVVIMMLTLLGALAGLALDYVSAVSEFRDGLSTSSLVNGFVRATDQKLVIDVLSVFVLIELFRTFTDYLEFRRVRLRILTEVGIAFVLREIFIGLYDHSLEWPYILALSVLLAVLVTARIAAVRFPSSES